MNNSTPHRQIPRRLLSAVFELDLDLVKESIEARFAPQMTAMLLRELDEQIRKRVATASLAIASGTEIREVLARLSKELKRYFDIRTMILSLTVNEKTGY